MTNDPFDILRNVKTLNPESYGNLTGPISGLYVLFLNITTIGFVCSCIITGIKLTFFSRNPSVRAQLKSDFSWKSVLTLIVFSFTFIIDIIFAFSTGLV